MPTETAFRKHYLLCGFYLFSIVAYVLFCHLAGDRWRWPLDEPTRIMVRTILYGVSIVLFPLTNLLRAILLRLNQTMPGPRSAAERYFTTITVTQTLLHHVAMFGLLMFWLGDDFNTLYIFSVLGCLAIYLHRPRDSEYTAIVSALSQ